MVFALAGDSTMTSCMCPVFPIFMRTRTRLTMNCPRRQERGGYANWWQKNKGAALYSRHLASGMPCKTTSQLHFHKHGPNHRKRQAGLANEFSNRTWRYDEIGRASCREKERRYVEN